MISLRGLTVGADLHAMSVLVLVNVIKDVKTYLLMCIESYFKTLRNQFWAIPNVDERLLTTHTNKIM